MTAILGVVGGLIAASGWFFAWRSRGEASRSKDAANHEAERARMAEARADAAEARMQDAAAGEATASMMLKVLQVEAAGLRMSIQQAAADREALLEELAKLGAPVGDVLLDSTTDRLYKNRDRGSPGNGQSAGSGGDPVIVPGDPTPTPPKTDAN